MFFFVFVVHGFWLFLVYGFSKPEGTKLSHRSGNPSHRDPPEPGRPHRAERPYTPSEKMARSWPQEHKPQNRGQWG